MNGIDPTMFDLFREEVRTHCQTLSDGLIALESSSNDPQRIEALMRAAHSIKGAARIVGIDPAVQLAHVMEDAFVAAQSGRIAIAASDIDLLLQSTDVLAGLGDLPDPGAIHDWASQNATGIGELVIGCRNLVERRPADRHAEASKTTSPKQVELEAGPRTELPAAFEVEWPIIPDVVIALPDGMHSLFQQELRNHLRTLAAIGQLLESADARAMEELLDGLRQLRGAAKLMAYSAIEVVLASSIDAFSSLRDQNESIPKLVVDWFRFFLHILAPAINVEQDSFGEWLAGNAESLALVGKAFEWEVQKGSRRSESSNITEKSSSAKVASGAEQPAATVAPALAPSAAPADGFVRVTAQNLTRLMGLAGESLVQARWLNGFSGGFTQLKKHHEQIDELLDSAHQGIVAGQEREQVAQTFKEIRDQFVRCREQLARQSREFDNHAAHAEDLNTRLYREVISSRMRPFGDGTHGFARMVRDMARTLGKQAQLAIVGEKTEVDRDVLEQLEAPLSHLIRNAVDHGLDDPESRAAAGKPEVGTVRLEARHRAGMLSVTVADDGRGIDIAQLRGKIVERGLSKPELVRQMSEQELLEFLFLPGFSTANSITEFSGRGVGLDVVNEIVRKVGGSVRVTTRPGQGTKFHLQVPITLSVIRAVVVDIGGEPYAFPHTRIDQLIRARPESIHSVENRQFVLVDGANVGLVHASQILDVHAEVGKNELSIILLSDQSGTYGLVVDAFRGEQDLVVRPLDPRLGKVPNLSAAAILDDGEPVLIVDVEDLIRSMDQFIQSGTLRRYEAVAEGIAVRKKRILVVDDSITVREVQRQLLTHQGYEVAVAVDGMDGWNQVRGGYFDLMISDVDMPRMDGIQLVKAVRGEEKIKNLPVIIVSYKEREEDRLRGLEAGANAYLTKSSFHDNRFIRTVQDFVGIIR